MLPMAAVRAWAVMLVPGLAAWIGSMVLGVGRAAAPTSFPLSSNRASFCRSLGIAYAGTTPGPSNCGPEPVGNPGSRP